MGELGTATERCNGAPKFATPVPSDRQGMRGSECGRCILCLLLVCLASVSTQVSPEDLRYLKSTDVTAVWKWIHVDGVGLGEPIESSSSSGAESESSEGQIGLGHITVSDGQEFAAACEADGSFKIYRVQMYPNLYPENWGYILYGRGWAERGSYKAVECSLSEDGSVLLWRGVQNDTLTAQVFRKGKSHSPYGGPSCHGEVLDHSRFEIVFPQDNYNDAWALLQSAPVPGVHPVLSAALSRNGEWLAFIRGNLLSIASLQCKHTPSVQSLTLPDGFMPSSPPEDAQHATRGRAQIVFSADSQAAWIIAASTQHPSTSIQLARLSPSGQWELSSLSLAPAGIAGHLPTCMLCDVWY
eukprot:3141191-Rhodomonas_salina.7